MILLHDTQLSAV